MLDRLLGPDAARQRHAVVEAATGDVTVIAGGPGTGKTFTIGALLAALASDGGDAVPAGRRVRPDGEGGRPGRRGPG